MDTRQQSASPTLSSTQSNHLNNQQLTDSLIYNIMKKIQLRQSLISEYNQQKQQSNKNLLTKYFLHNQIPAYYATAVVFSKIIRTIYMQAGSTGRIFSIPNTLFHVCVFISLNEYYKYRNIFLVGRQHGDEYKIYKQNVEQLMQQKMETFSLVNKIQNAQWMNPDKLMAIFKYRLVV